MTLDEITAKLAQIKGVIGVSIVDYGSGMMMSSYSNDANLDLEIASACCVNIIRAKVSIQKRAWIDDVLHDIQINMHDYIDLICPCSNKESTFIYIMAKRDTVNLSVIRRSVFAAEKLVTF